MVPTQQVVSIPMAAAYLRTSPKRVRRLIAERSIPTLRLGPRRTYVALKDVENLKIRVSDSNKAPTLVDALRTALKALEASV